LTQCPWISHFIPNIAKMTHDRIEYGIEEFEMTTGIKADPEVFEFYKDIWFKPFLLQHVSPLVDQLAEACRKELCNNANGYISNLEQLNMTFLSESIHVVCQGVIALTVMHPQFPLSREQEELVGKYQRAIEDKEEYRAVLREGIFNMFDEHVEVLKDALSAPKGRRYILKAQSYAKSISELEKHYGDVIPAPALAEANELAARVLSIYAQYPEFYDLLCALSEFTSRRYPPTYFT
jgi:hypothetical protein